MDIEGLLGIFYEEARERLDELESRLLELESRSDDREALDSAFRAAHNLKGSAGLAGIHSLSDVAHVMEDIFDQARDGRAPIRKEDVSLLLQGVDLLRAILDVHQQEGQERLPSEYAEVVERLRDRAGRRALADGSPAVQHGATRSRTRFRIRMKFRPDFFLTGQDPLFLLFELVGLGEPVEILCDTNELPALRDLDPERLYLSWEVLLDTDVPKSRVESVFEFAQYDGTIEIEEVLDTPSAKQKERAQEPPGSHPKGDVQESDKVRVHSAGPPAKTLRVRSDRVDRVIDLVSDLGIQISRLEAAILQKGKDVCPDIQRGLEGVHSLVRELQHDALQLRMVPVAEQFSRFVRLVRDTAASLGKEVAFVIEGGETELERQLLDSLWDPLKHLIRNAVDHGIERPEERMRLGKPIPGRLWLRAYERSGRVVIEVEDDGRGLDIDKIRARAKELGVQGGGDLSEPGELLRLLSLPGFSTAERVTEVSGRGVGLDVVFQAVQKLGGHLTVNTRKGEGTTFRIAVPLTQAILDAVLFRDGELTFLVPVGVVKEVFVWDQQGVSVSQRARILHHRGKLYPAVRLSDLLIFEWHRSGTGRTAILVRGDATEFVLVVDEVLEPRQVVVKSLEEAWRRVPGISGATILSDGTVGLILDLHQIEEVVLSSNWDKEPFSRLLDEAGTVRDHSGGE